MSFYNTIILHVLKFQKQLSRGWQRYEQQQNASYITITLDVVI